MWTRWLFACVLLGAWACEAPAPPLPPEKETDEVKEDDNDKDKDNEPAAPRDGGAPVPCVDAGVGRDAGTTPCVNGPRLEGGAGFIGRLVLFADRDLRGQSLVITGQMENLVGGPFNDHSRSLTVEGGPWEVCEHTHFDGACASFGPGSVFDLGAMNDKISSVRPRLPR
jgi:hypothetical protein